jgi:arylsulfatase A-like enzyme
MRRFLVAAILSLLAAGAALAQEPSSQKARPNNVILFVPDGLRASKVSKDLTPAMASVRDEGVNFKNSHSLFPTFTTANASAMATGHYLGDTGDFSNTIYTGFPVLANKNSGNVTPFIENDQVLAEIDDHLGENYLNEETILMLARQKGYSTAAIGKLGPTFIFDHTAWSGIHTIVIDDATGTTGVPLSEELAAAIKEKGLDLIAPKRQATNGNPGDATTPGATEANVEQQDYFAKTATQVVLPLFKKRNQPFVMVYWSRDPDGTQHNQSDGNLQTVPGINGPTSHKGIRNADDNLKRLRDTLTELGLAENTNIIVAADHGFSTISKESKTSPAAKADYKGVPKDFLPPGFLAIDLAKALNLPLFETLGEHKRVGDGAIPNSGNGLIGNDPAKPDAIVAANGGSDLIYLPGSDRKLAARIVDALLAQDYVSGIFVRDDLGPVPGTLPMSASNLKGKAATPTPAIAVNFRSWHAGCDQPLVCAIEIADTGLQQGQGMHGSFSRADTNNFMAAIGPDFKKGFVDEAPVSNADVGKTIAHLLQLKTRDKGTLVGRMMSEAFTGGTMPKFDTQTKRSAPGANGLRTVLEYQRVGKTLYFDAAGFPGRTVGLAEPEKAAAR